MGNFSTNAMILIVSAVICMTAIIIVLIQARGGNKVAKAIHRLGEAHENANIVQTSKLNEFLDEIKRSWRSDIHDATNGLRRELNEAGAEGSGMTGLSTWTDPKGVPTHPDVPAHSGDDMRPDDGMPQAGRNPHVGAEQATALQPAVGGYELSESTLELLARYDNVEVEGVLYDTPLPFSGVPEDIWEYMLAKYPSLWPWNHHPLSTPQEPLTVYDVEHAVLERAGIWTEHNMHGTWPGLVNGDPWKKHGPPETEYTLSSRPPSQQP